jgi:hypothetical protein
MGSAPVRDDTSTPCVHSTVPLGGHVRGCELPATPGVPLPTKGTRTGESTRHTGRDAEGGGSFRAAQKRRSLPADIESAPFLDLEKPSWLDDRTCEPASEPRRVPEAEPEAEPDPCSSCQAVPT